MSDNILKLIPISPEYTPEDLSIKKAIDLLTIYFPEADEIYAKLTENIRFIDSGSNLIKVLCPICGAELDTTWWQDAMDNAYQVNFTNLIIKTPCCNTTISLNELHYEWPVGFARFSLEVRNPNSEISQGQLGSLELIIGSPLKKILSHY